MKPMSEVFELPVVAKREMSSDVAGEFDFVINDKTGDQVSEFISMSTAHHAAHAVNCHDLMAHALEEVLNDIKDMGKKQIVIRALQKVRGE